MIQIPLTPEQYQAALKHLMDAKSPDVDSLTLPVGDVAGQFSNHLLTAQFSFDGTNLNITPLAKHGLARFASEDTIKAHLVDLLGKV